MQSMPLKSTQLAVKVLADGAKEFNLGLLVVLTRHVLILHIGPYTEIPLQIKLCLLASGIPQPRHGLVGPNGALESQLNIICV